MDPAKARQKCEASFAWETVRLTRSYQVLRRTYVKETIPLLKHIGKPTLARDLQYVYLLKGLREALGHPYVDFLMNGFDPGLNWLQLTKSQRTKACGFIMRDQSRWQAHEPFTLPRQAAARPVLTLDFVESFLTSSGQLRFGGGQRADTLVGQHVV